MGRTLYLECYSGISGDMTAAALLDLGADREVLEKVLESLPLDGFDVKVSRVVKSGIDACDFDVVLEQENHDHDMEYLHGHSHTHGTHIHEGHIYEAHEEHHHEGHEHSHEELLHNHGEHHHEHRGMKEIRQIIEQGRMTERARETALNIFRVLAEAEAKAHNVPVEEVHFHEVGAVDSIVDIVSVAVCLDNLDITEVIVPVLYEGKGTVRCQHGILPVPVPAAAEIVRANKLNVHLTEVQGELVTPTGAAIAAAVKTADRLPSKFSIEKTGIGAGKRQYECPGILRAMVIRNREEEKDTIVKMETNIDDCSGEALGYVMERLMAAGARDVHYVPAYMKKNRPAWVLNVICTKEDMKRLQEIIFRETTTIGIRCMEMERVILKREKQTVKTPFGDAEVKVCTYKGEKRWFPEYESVAKISRENQISYIDAYNMILKYTK